MAYLLHKTHARYLIFTLRWHCFDYTGAESFDYGATRDWKSIFVMSDDMAT